MRPNSSGRLYDFGDIVRIPEGARIMVVSDIHGNYEDFKKYVKIWEKGGKDTHIIFLGDLIHGTSPENDKSVQILLDAFKYNKNNNFHLLMGNHEWYQIHDKPIYKMGVNQTEGFSKYLKDCSITPEILYEFMGTFKKFAVTPNGLFICHAGPSHYMGHLLNEINSGLSLSPVIDQNDIDNAFESMVFARPTSFYNDDGYTQYDVNSFLKKINMNFMICGHTPVNGWQTVGNQLIFDSSFATQNKYYLSMMSDEPIEDICDITSNLILLEEINNSLKE